MKPTAARVVLLAWLFVNVAVVSPALQVIRKYDPATKTWKEAPQSIEAIGDKSAYIELFRPEGGDSKSIAALELKGSLEFMSTGIVKGEESMVSVGFFDPPTYDQTKPAKWQKITKAELVQGRVVITMEDAKVFTIYGVNGFSAVIEPGRVIPEPPKPADK